MKLFFIHCLLFSTFLLFSQATISGKVLDEKGNPVEGVNVFIEGTYDGGATNQFGEFHFTTTVIGDQYFIISFISYEKIREMISVGSFKSKTFRLLDSVNSLDTVVINAGTFEAGDNSRISVLKALDIVTTAGSPGDIVSALQTLPGTQMVGESGRLFVRGGEADETQTYIDGVRVAQPYSVTTNGIPSRGRFSPFLFKGMSFSTGGYSAEYGEALSSVLLLSSIDEPDQEKTEISLMTVGLGLSNTQKRSKSSFSFNMAYTDLAPYQSLIEERIDWNKPYQSLSGETVYRYQFNEGLLKIYTAFNVARFDLNQEDINNSKKVRVDLNNTNLYFNGTYKGHFGEGWGITSGLSYGYNHNKKNIEDNGINEGEYTVHLKLKLSKNFSERIKFTFGGDYFSTKFDEDYFQKNGLTFNHGYQNTIGAFYVESDLFFSKKLATKIGLRASNNNLLQEFAVSPRVSLAYKLNKKNQLSLAYGDFIQTPKQNYLKYTKNLDSERTIHYILNYLYNKEGQTFRAEVYYKKYNDLVKYDTQIIAYNSQFNNDGNGFAKGLDLFWRDNYNLKNTDYWISYSYINTKRDFRNYPRTVTPDFVANHTFSVVGKYWVSTLKSQFGATYSYTSGRPYNDPNKLNFMTGKTKDYNNLSLNCAYLVSAQKIIYFSVSNVLGVKNIFGYDYADKPDSSGTFKSQIIAPTADRFFFIGFFWTISSDKKSNQLDNL